MTETPAPDPVTKAARDLSAIEELAALLGGQALARSADRLMPGGRAMVALGPEADLDAWADRIDTAERWHYARCEKAAHRDCPIAEHVADEDDQDTEPPLQTLLFWSEAWRVEHGYPLEGRSPTLVSEAAFIRHLLAWAWDNEPHWDDFARDINRARRALEDVLYAGRRPERTRVLCEDRECGGPRLIKVYQRAAAEDFYKCPVCKRRYSRDDYARAYARQLRSEGAERYVPLRDALGILRAHGRAERTVRQWLADGRATSHRDADSGRHVVWWPDLWHLHLTTPTRNRAAS